MDIGGLDLVIDCDPKRAYPILVSAIASSWPHCLVDFGTAELDRPLVEVQNLPSAPSDSFFYASEASAKAWGDHGWTEQYASAMIYVICSYRSMTAVVEPNSPAQALVENAFSQITVVR